MQKAEFRRITLLVLIFCFGISKALLAQTAADTLGFTWKLLEVTDPTVEAKVLFTPKIAATATFTSWDFGDGNTSTDSIATYSFTAIDTFTVSLNFKLNSNDSTITHKVFANSAAFSVQLESDDITSFVRILKSWFRIPQNDRTLLGNMRFEWSVNGTVLSDVNFPTATDYQYPNIRYTFEESGTNTVSLRAWNTADPTKETTFTQKINIPTPTAKIKLANIPNVFTPNGDNVLDFFEVTGNGLSRLVFKVFSRSGSLVYENEASVIKWDGQNDNGKDLPEGVYYYIIEDRDGIYENEKGFVYIFRGK
jgi:gliding motility-associated-like protein